MQVCKLFTYVHYTRHKIISDTAQFKYLQEQNKIGPGHNISYKSAFAQSESSQDSPCNQISEAEADQSIQWNLVGNAVSRVNSEFNAFISRLN